MFKRITTVLLFGGLLGLVPTAAQAAPAAPAEVTQAGSEPAAGYDLFHKDRDEDHYRCMYRCDERKHYKKHKHRYHHKQRCWYYGPNGWYQARCGRHRWHARHDHDKKSDKWKKSWKKDHDHGHGHGHHHHGHGDDDHHHHHHHGDGAHASGGYDSHREHPRDW
jgi:hypothetical protein